MMGTIAKGVIDGISKSEVSKSSFNNLSKIDLNKISPFENVSKIYENSRINRILKEDSTPEQREIIKKADLKIQDVNGRDCLGKREITDLDDVVDKEGRTNLGRMKSGMSPIVEDKPLELHHQGQKMDSVLCELTAQEHKGNYKILHPEGNKHKTEIDRNEFSKERREHWKARADELEKSL